MDHDTRTTDRRAADLQRILDVEPQPGRMLVGYLILCMVALAVVALLLEAVNARDDIRATRRAVEVRPCR